MKRRDAFRKLRTVCDRLDHIAPDAPYVRPRQLYIFGSTLTDKPDPDDVDLLLVIDRLSDDEAEEIAPYIVRSARTPLGRAVSQITRGMQKVCITLELDKLARWPLIQLFQDKQGIRLVWECGMDWQPVVNHIEANPSPWTDPHPSDEETLERLRAIRLSDKERTQLAKAIHRQERQRIRASLRGGLG